MQRGLEAGEKANKMKQSLDELDENVSSEIGDSVDNVKDATGKLKDLMNKIKEILGEE